MKSFTREELEAKTVKELKQLCVRQLSIPGLTKKPKKDIVQAILDHCGEKPVTSEVTQEKKRTSMKSFTREELEAKTVKELKQLCVRQLSIPGLTKKPKKDIVQAILDHCGEKPVTSEVTQEKMKGLEFDARSVITQPKARFGAKTTTTVHVSCGASSGDFPVVGRTVKEIGEFLREVLNVSQLSTGLVNGRSVSPSYVMKPGDSLEFIKPAGKKG